MVAEQKVEACCLPQCSQDATYYIQQQGAPYDDYTAACDGHLAVMGGEGVSLIWPVRLGTPGYEVQG